jgi:hypothetical protein
MRVTSLDDRLETLIAVRARGDEEAGTAYAFRRQEGDGALAGQDGTYRLKWSARGLTKGMDSALAIDVDTYIELHGGSVSQAVRASLRRAGARDLNLTQN